MNRWVSPKFNHKLDILKTRYVKMIFEQPEGLIKRMMNNVLKSIIPSQETTNHAVIGQRDLLCVEIYPYVGSYISRECDAGEDVRVRRS